MNERPYRIISSLKFILSIPFVSILIISAGLTGYLGFQNGINSAYDLTHQLLSESAARVHDKLDSYFATPQLLINYNLAAIQLNQLNLNNTRELELEFLSQVRSYENIKGVTYADEQNRFIGAYRNYFGSEFVIGESTEETDFTLIGYVSSAQGELGEILYTRPNNLPTTRVWYQAAVDAGQHTWSPIYTLIDQLGIAVDLVAPVYDENNRLLGVLDVSLELSGIGEFLEEIATGEANQVFIVDETGMIIASSTLADAYATVDGELQRFDSQTVDEPIIQNATHEITKLFGAWSNITSNQQFGFEIDSERQLAQVMPYHLGDLSWWIIVSKPEASYLTPINQNIHTTVALIALLLILSVLGMSLIAGWISHPLTRLSHVAQSLAAGNWQERSPIHPISEISQLATAFNQMASELQASVPLIQSREERFRAIFENSSDAILLAQNGLQISGNPAYFAMFGYAPTDKLTGRPVLEIAAPAERQRIAEYIRLRSEGKFAPSRYEALGLRQDGTEFTFEIHVSTFYEGAELYSLAIFRDISQWKKAEEALLQSTELLDQQKYRLTERIKELNCLYEHSKLLEKSEITIAELCQGTIALIPPAWQYPEITCARMMLEGEIYITANWQETIWQKSSPIWLDGIEIGSVTVCYLEERRPEDEGAFFKEEGMLLNELAQRLGHKIKELRAELALKQSYETLEQKVIERTRELKIAEAALRDALATEKELGELKTRFVSMASHEFRTPLASILALSETLAAYRHKLPESEIDECLEQINGQVVHLKNLVEEVLLLTRMQARRQEFNPVKQNIHALLLSIINEFRKRPNIKHQIIYSSNGESAELLLDTKLMRQLISNLLTNAIKYSAEDKPVEIVLDCGGKTAFISIRDYGIGIPESDIRHLFEPFHRASNVGIISGTGLGLVIAKESVELHGGTITVESQLNQGTSFRVSIPIVAEKANQNDENTGD